MSQFTARLRRNLCALAFAATGLATLSSCSQLSQLAGALNYGGQGAMQPPRPPSVQVTAVTLAQAPDAQALAAYYCTQVAPPPVCMLIGPQPSRESMRFYFNVDLNFRNENPIPLPAAEALAAFTAYPQARNAHNLGALCVSLCESGTCPPPGPEACRSRSGDIRTIEDFAGAAVNFLINVATGQTRPEDVRVRTIPPNGSATARLTLALDPDQTLRLIQQLSEGVIQQVQRGQTPVFEIPYRFEGTVWVNVERFGRIAATIPPFEGRWRIEPPRNAGGGPQGAGGGLLPGGMQIPGLGM